MLEYAAAGIPIVARDLPEMRNCYEDGAFFYTNAEEFDAQLTKILQPASEEEKIEVSGQIDAMKPWLEGRSWDEIANRMLDELAARLESGPPGPA